MNLDIKKIKSIHIFYAGIIGFILSFLSGLFSRNTFSAILFNSIISAIVLGLVILLCNLLLLAFLPELLEDKTEDDDGDSESQIDIVMPEESYNVNNYDNSDNSYADEENSGYNGNDSSEHADGFKEISMDNLSPFDSYVSEASMDLEQDDLDPPPVIKNKKGDSNFNSHSPEEMAKAVKTVLKKE